MTKVVLKTEIPGTVLINRGKVRDIYDAGEYLIIVATDRISAFDVVMNEGIPFKGIVLTQISKFWFEKTAGIVNNHFVTTDVEKFPAPFHNYSELLDGRSMMVKKANPFPVECIVRGYLAGSGWREYRQMGTLHGGKLKAGLQNSSKLPRARFTPSTKAESGHDQNISFKQLTTIIGEETSRELRRISIKLYRYGANLALKSGIIIADTKFEFGLLNGQIILIDEILTPDSSRFWPAATYQPGKNQPSLDKQYLRDYLETLDWDKTYPAPPLPDEIVENVSKKYCEIFQIITGKSIDSIIKS